MLSACDCTYVLRSWCRVEPTVYARHASVAQLMRVVCVVYVKRVREETRWMNFSGVVSVDCGFNGGMADRCSGL